MKDKSMDINLWQVFSSRGEREYSAFYKTIVLNTKAIAIKIDQDEFKSLTEKLHRGEKAQEFMVN
jgi:hypothetical protein